MRLINGFLNENPRRWDGLRADLRPYGTPNCSSMLQANILAFQLSWSKPHSRCGPARSTSMETPGH